MGEETYYIDKITDHILKNCLSDEEKAFNQVTLYGKDTDIASIISESKQYPFSANFRIVVVKEAQHIRSIEKLESYIENHLKSTILVICYKGKTLDKRKKVTKKILKTGVLFESKPLYENQISKFINDYILDLGYKIDTRSCQTLKEHLGNDLTKISNELDKLTINIKKDDIITSDIIEKNIGINKDYNIYEFQRSIGEKNIVKSFKITDYFSRNEKNNPFLLITSSLFSYFNKIMLYHQLKEKKQNDIANILGIHPYFLKEYINASKNYSSLKLFKIFKLLNEYDLKAKGIKNNSTSNGELLKELTWKILN